MNKSDFVSYLYRVRACDEAKVWVAGIDLSNAIESDFLSLIWERCDRGDWLLWLAGRAEVKREVVVLACCRCARLALPFAEGTEAVSRKTIEVAEAWTRGEATIEEVRTAADAAVYAVDAGVYAYAAVYAVYAGVYAADAANAADAAVFAANAANAADAGVYAAYAAYANAYSRKSARAKMLADCAREVRLVISADMVREAILSQEGKTENV